jgi:hypothetical protein
MADRKFKVFLDSGANIHSRREQVVSLKDMGLSSEQYDAMSEDEREEFWRDVAFDQSEWGFYEVTDGDSHD